MGASVSPLPSGLSRRPTLKASPVVIMHTATATSAHTQAMALELAHTRASTWRSVKL